MHTDTRVWIAWPERDRGWRGYTGRHYLQQRGSWLRIEGFFTEKEALQLEHELNPPLLREPWPQRPSYARYA